MLNQILKFLQEKSFQQHLENEYRKALKKRKELFELSIGQSLVIDAWTNERNESIFDVMICTPEPVFLKTIETGEDAHSANEMMKFVDPILEELGIDSACCRY